MGESVGLPAELEQIKADESKALRAPKDIGDDAHPDAEGVDARTAARYAGVEDGVPLFDVVTTRVSGFPIGADMHSQQPQTVVARWARDNDVEVIDASDEEWSA